MTRFARHALCALLMLAPAAVVDAQKNKIEKLYGDGVHAFHAGQLESAIATFDEAVELGCQDPRVFYYRGVAHMKLDDSANAKSDFAKGAKLEFQPLGRFFPVNRSLERVQGVVRIELENARTIARKTARANRLSAIARDSKTVVPMIPDAKTNRTAGRRNYPDVSGKVIPGTPFADVRSGNSEQPAATVTQQAGSINAQVSTAPKSDSSALSAEAIDKRVKNQTKAAPNPFQSEAGTAKKADQANKNEQPPKKDGGEDNPFDTGG